METTKCHLCSYWLVVITVINPSGAEIVICFVNQVNTMAADALAPRVARSAAAMVLTM